MDENANMGRVFERLNDIAARLPEIEHNQREMLRRQDITNGRIAKLETWQVETEMSRAREDGYRAGAAGSLVTRKQAAAAVTTIAAVAGMASAIAGLIVRMT